MPFLLKKSSFQDGVGTLITQHELKTIHTGNSDAWGLRRMEPTSSLVSGSIGFPDVTVKRILDFLKS